MATKKLADSTSGPAPRPGERRQAHRSSVRRVVIVGGGVVGCAAAYELSRIGHNVTVLERDGLAAHASGWNAGNVNPLFGASVGSIPQALEAFRLHAAVREELSSLGLGDFSLAPVERVLLGFVESDRAELERTADLYRSASGFSSRWLEREAIRRLEPRIGPEVAFGLLTTGSLSLDSGAFTRSLARAASMLGATIRLEEASGVDVRADRVVAVRTTDGAIGCDEIVLATGPWVEDWRRWLGVDIPVQPVKGEMLLLDLPGGSPPCDLTYGATSLYRRRGGQIWLGVTMTQEGFDCSPTDEARQSLLSRAARMLPASARAEVLNHIASLRPVATPNEPIARRAPGFENVLIANGGGSKGVLHCVALARTIGALVSREHAAQSSLAPDTGA